MELGADPALRGHKFGFGLGEQRQVEAARLSTALDHEQQHALATSYQPQHLQLGLGALGAVD